MPIQFACPECGLRYSVKDELAGKGAKCGKCGHKMKIPQAAAQAAPAGRASSTASAVAAKAKPTAPAAPKSAAKPAAKSDAGLSSWLDDELETSRKEVKAKPQLPPASAACPSCNAPLAAGAVLCVKCGYDTRTRGRRTVALGDEDEAAPKRSKLGTAASLLRGTAFSFLAAMLGALIWAVLAYLTHYEFSIVAIGLGGLAGLGMAIGHEDDDGTFAGIIAAFMSLVGIVAAKIMIIVIFISVAISSVIGEMANPVEIQRTALAMSLASKQLEAEGVSDEDVTEDQWNAAVETARQEVAGLTPEQVELRFQMLIQAEADEEAAEEDADGDAAVEEGGEPEDVEAIEAPDDDEMPLEVVEAEDEVGFGSLLGELFGPIDGIFILLAFFTAYKVGSGQATD